MKKLFGVFLILLFAYISNSQNKLEVTDQDYINSDVEMADQFRADGKIYVLTGIILIILFGIVTYLVIIDRKVARIEKERGKTFD
ncbi:MAG: CcmD family protein [Bacteroidota bacterium]